MYTHSIEYELADGIIIEASGEFYRGEIEYWDIDWPSDSEPRNLDTDEKEKIVQALYDSYRRA
jgi:hypothetical protein